MEYRLDQTVAPGVRNLGDLPIGVLHLGAKTKVLEEAGFRTLADIGGRDAATLLQVASIGRRTVEELTCNHAALRNATDVDGVIDWEAYCATVGIPLLPARIPLDGHEFVSGLPAYLAALADVMDDKILSTILLHRTCKSPVDQKTLEEIGVEASPALTRERVRQKERKLLEQITGGLLNDAYDGLGVHFHPGFSIWWRKAADALANVEEIDVVSFVALLARVWNVPQAAVMAQLAPVLAIVTGEPQMAAGFRALARLDPRLFTAESRDLRNLPVLKLHMGKTAVRLADAGMQIVGDVVDSLRSGDLDRMKIGSVKQITDHLNLLASCLDTDGIDWGAYRAKVDLEILPAMAFGSPADFVRTLPQVIEDLLRRHETSLRAAEIFRLRTGKDARERPTLHQVGEKLGTFGPSIKREETILLAWLNDILVSREFCSLLVWLDGAWLAWWGEAEETFQACDDYDRFADNLAVLWRLGRAEISVAAPTLWAVFTGYPDGRPPRYRPVGSAERTEIAPGRIRLQGFRRVH